MPMCHNWDDGNQLVHLDVTDSQAVSFGLKGLSQSMVEALSELSSPFLREATSHSFLWSFSKKRILVTRITTGHIEIK